MHNEHKLKIFACKASKEFALKVAKALNVELGDSDVITFSDGEFQPSYNESVRGATVMLSTKWNGNNYLFAMNGQTGKLIGDLPVCKKQVLSWFFKIWAPLAAVLAVLMFLA